MLSARCSGKRVIDSLLTRRGFWMAAAVLVCSTGLEQSRLFASGCNYHHSVAQANDLPDGVVQIYEYGEFRYYKPATLPCSGPSCDGSSPGGFQAPALSMSDDQRQPVPVWRGCESILGLQVGRILGEPANLYHLLSDQLLLRPPCVS
jgi:hypothetical protein